MPFNYIVDPYLIFLLSNFLLESFTIDQPLLKTPNEVLQEGQHRLTQIKSQMPRYGECWKQAVTKLEQGCKMLTDESQSRMALAFTNCFLENIGIESYHCDANTDLKKCLKDISDKAFISYTEFFTHTQNICFFLQSQIWHEETGETIARLTVSSAKVMRQLDHASTKQVEMILAQNKAIDNQKDILSHGSKLKGYLENSQQVAKEIFEEFRTTTVEQKLLITDIFDRVSKLQNFIIDEFTGVYTVSFYIFAIILTYLTTSSPRTLTARFWLFLIITVNFALERYLSTSYVNIETLEEKFLDRNGPIFLRIWIARKIACLMCGFVLIYCALSYKDLNSINYQMLSEIKKQMDIVVNSNGFKITSTTANNNAENHLIVKDDDGEHFSSEECDSDDSFSSVYTSHSSVICSANGLSARRDTYKLKVNRLRSQPRYNLRNRSIMQATTPIITEEVESITEAVEKFSEHHKI